MLTSLKYQLHDNVPFYVVQLNANKTEEFFAGLVATYDLNEEKVADALNRLTYCNMRFSFDVLFNPEKVNVTIFKLSLWVRAKRQNNIKLSQSGVNSVCCLFHTTD